MVAKRWTVETLNATVDKEFASLPADMRGRYRRVAEIIEEFGLDQVPRNMLRKLRGADLGDSDSRSRWDLSGALRNCP